MKLKKAQLRDCGRFALEQRGFRVELKNGPGIVPGARLLAMKGSELRRVAVRTSLDREVGLTRHPDGSWLTLPNVDEVVVVVPSLDDPNAAEVFGFERDAIKAAFDRALAAQKVADSWFSPKAPVFIALDEKPRRKLAAHTSGLKMKAQWQAEIPLASVPPRTGSASDSVLGFVERVKQDFAQLNGVDVSKVAVEFRIMA
jgi:hypothetical protein